MPGIANLTVEEFQERINRFDQKYVRDWNSWLNTQENARATRFGNILRKWQACRPNRMRRIRTENQHDAPYLEDLIAHAAPHLRILRDFDIRENISFTKTNCDSLEALWCIFRDLSYQGRARNGQAGIVAISKAALLLTDGGIGPAFDSKVRGHLNLQNIGDANQWIEALKIVSRDIQNFEANNQIKLAQAAPHPHGGLQNGRIYDMALGPGG